MNLFAGLFVTTVLGAALCAALQQPQQVGWASQDQAAQFAPARQPIAADLQNQVNALSAQLASANRQLQYFQQQLSMIQPQPQLQATAQPQAQLQQQQQLALQQQQQQQQAALQQQQQQQAALQQQQQQQAALQQQGAPQQYFGQPAAQAPAQPQPLISSLVDEADLATDPRYNSQANRLYQQQQAEQQQQQQAQQQDQLAAQQRAQQQQLAAQAQAQAQAPQLTSPFQQAPTSTTVGPPSIEPSFEAAAPVQQAPPANLAPPHNPPRNDDKFAIGLGVLSPGYTQKFGNTALDFNQDKNGFSFTLSNNGHSNQPQTVKPAAGTTN